MKPNYEDIFNIYAVYFGYRSGTLIDTNFELVKKLKLNLKTNLILDNCFGHKITVFPCVTKNKIKKNIVSEKELGNILGYFCSNHNWSSQNDVEKIMVHIRFKIGNILVVPFPMICENNKLTQVNSENFIKHLEKIRIGYIKIAENLNINITEPKIVLTKCNFKNLKTNVKLNPKQFLKWKNVK